MNQWVETNYWCFPFPFLSPFFPVLFGVGHLEGADVVIASLICSCKNIQAPSSKSLASFVVVFLKASLIVILKFLYIWVKILIED